MRLMLVSSLPNALVATQVKRAESALSDLLMLIVDRTPSVTISSRTVYLKVIKISPTFKKNIDLIPRVNHSVKSLVIHVP